MILNQGADATKTVEVSLNGYSTHFSLDPSTPSKALSFDNRVISLMWFRLAAGSAGPVTIEIIAWGSK